MKILVLSLILVWLSPAFSGGGIDVGNGRFPQVKVYTQPYDSEQQLLKNIKYEIAFILANRNPLAQSIVNKAKCSNKIKIKHISIAEFYLYQGRKKSLKRQIQSGIDLMLQDCKRPAYIPKEVGQLF